MRGPLTVFAAWIKSSEVRRNRDGWWRRRRCGPNTGRPGGLPTTRLRRPASTSPGRARFSRQAINEREDETTEFEVTTTTGAGAANEELAEIEKVDVEGRGAPTPTAPPSQSSQRLPSSRIEK